MKSYLYLSLIPESLIASMLPPAEFGNYLATGTKKRTRGEAMFFEVSRDFKSKNLPLAKLDERCVPHPDGQPKRSVYLSIYRVLEFIPIDALRDLYLVTDDGRVLQLQKQDYKHTGDHKLHLYQELCPVTPQIVSNLDPQAFCRLVTDRKKSVSVPRLVFAELMLNDLAQDPVAGSADNLPYTKINHLRDCLSSLKQNPEKNTKTVIRYIKQDVLYRTIKNGFFAGDDKEFCYYPFPSEKEMEENFHDWWRSALTTGY